MLAISAIDGALKQDLADAALRECGYEIKRRPEEPRT
jgi:hypothetical protein